MWVRIPNLVLASRLAAGDIPASRSLREEPKRGAGLKNKLKHIFIYDVYHESPDFFEKSK